MNLCFQGNSASVMCRVAALDTTVGDYGGTMDRKITGDYWQKNIEC